METISAQVDILNDEESTRKERVKALVVLSNLAIEEDNRDDLLDGIRQLSDTFENALIEKEEGSKNFSTKVGDMHQLVVLLFIRLMDYDFKTGDILDLFRYNFSLSLATIEISFKKVAYEDEVVLGLTRLLSGFAIPSTYFSGKGRQSMSERDCSEFSEKINMFVDKLRASQIISTWVSAVMRRVKKSKVGIQQVHCEMVNHGLNAFTNAYNFTTGNGATGFRQHLLVSEKLPSSILLPTLNAIITKYNEDMDQSIGPTTMVTIKNILKAFVLITFEMFSNTQHIKNINITIDLLTNEKIQQCIQNDSSILALILLYNVNIDSLVNANNDDDKQQEIDNISQQINTTWAKCQDKERVKRLFTTPGTLPVSRQIFTYRYIYDMLGCMEEEEEDEDEGSNYDIEEKAEETTKNEGKEEEEKNFRLLGNLPEVSGKKMKSNTNNTGWKVRGNNGCHNARKKKERKKKKKKKRKDETSTNQEYPVATPVVLGLPSEFLCAMNGQCLKEPMRSKINRSLVFEKKTIEGWFERCGNVCPITSTPLKPSDLVYDDNLAKQITSFMIQQSYQKNNNNFADDDDMYSF